MAVSWKDFQMQYIMLYIKSNSFLLFTLVLDFVFCIWWWVYFTGLIQFEVMKPDILLESARRLGLYDLSSEDQAVFNEIN